MTLGFLKPRYVKIAFLALIFFVSPALQLHAASQSQCDASVTCDNLDACDAFETYRIPFETIKKCIEQGTMPPLKWRPQDGREPTAQTIIRGDLESPFFPMPATNSEAPPLSESSLNSLNFPGPLGAGGGFNGSGFSLPDLMKTITNQLGPNQNWQSGPALASPPNCSTYTHPLLLEAGQLRGQTVPLIKAAGNQCGNAIATDQNWAIFTRNASHAAISIPSSGKLQLFEKKSDHLVYQADSQIPKFYCELRPCQSDSQQPECNPAAASSTYDSSLKPQFYAHKIPIIPLTHYAEFNAATKILPITVAIESGGVMKSLIDNYILMKRTSALRFDAPKPDPEYFISQGAQMVDPQCYSFENLFSETLPKTFGDIMLGSHNITDYDVKIIRPQNYLAESDPGTCAPFIQYYDHFKPTIYIPPGATVSYGQIYNGDAYSKTTVQFTGGSMRTGTDGSFYSGAFLTVPKADIYLSGSAGGINQQQFPAGAYFNLTSDRSVYIDPPGRIRLFSDHRMQLIDGGRIEDDRATILNIISPMAIVQFDPEKPVTGSAIHSLAPPSGSVIPTNKDNSAQLPYDARLDAICEKLHEGGIVN